MSAPLYKELIEYSHSKLAFHMPGHKFGSIADLSKMDLTALDNTETMGMDNLYEAEGIIKEAMILMADFYGAKETLFLTNGSTAGILASILSVCREGDQLIVSRNAHHSVWSGLTLAGVTPIYISPEFDKNEDVLGEIKAETIERAIKEYPNAKGVLIVSPTYEGITSDIQKIADIVHENNMTLIVDEAHGAHFVLGEPFPLSSVKRGADIVINSMHKTLPALTQSALLHICSERVTYEKVVQSLRMIQTSSPSYVMMGVMDYIRDYILNNSESIKQQYIKSLLKMRVTLKNNLKVLRLLQRDHKNYDVSKIIISTKESSISGYELADILYKEFNISIEAALDTYIILMTTMADKEETLSKLERALLAIDNMIVNNCKRECVNSFLNSDICRGKNPREIYYSEKVWIDLKESSGKISTNNIMLYPPGIPILCVGEAIDDRHKEIINRFKHKVQGIRLINEKILIQVCKY